MLKKVGLHTGANPYRGKVELNTDGVGSRPLEKFFKHGIVGEKVVSTSQSKGRESFPELGSCNCSYPPLVTDVTKEPRDIFAPSHERQPGVIIAFNIRFEDLTQHVYREDRWGFRHMVRTGCGHSMVVQDETGITGSRFTSTLCHTPITPCQMIVLLLFGAFKQNRNSALFFTYIPP